MAKAANDENSVYFFLQQLPDKILLDRGPEHHKIAPLGSGQFDDPSLGSHGEVDLQVCRDPGKLGLRTPLKNIHSVPSSALKFGFAVASKRPRGLYNIDQRDGPAETTGESSGPQALGLGLGIKLSPNQNRFR
jgi:hypothetical protein